MHIYSLQREQKIQLSGDEVFAFFSDPHNLEVLTPPWLRFRILTPDPIHMGVGTIIQYRLYWRMLPIAWTTKIVAWDPPKGFTDVQLRGPYRLWEHTHSFVNVAGGTLVRDVVRYALPFGALGRLAHRLWVRKDIEAIFDYRAQKITEILEPSRKT
ncbi:MAG: CDP-paratose 2-epimerase [Gemmataceae bacterium]